jgi:putative serine protease PepD
MSDDLFWPPVSGDGDDEPSPQGPIDGDDSHPTAAYDTEPLATAGSPSEVSAGGAHDRSRFVATAGVVAIIAFVFGAGGVLVGAKAFKNNDNDNDNAANLVPATSSGSGGSASPSALNTTPKSYAAIAARVLPSVVSINVTGSTESDTGSGIILKSNGYILTNNHVVAAAATGGTGSSVSVVFNDSSTATARIVGTDATDDLAVIKVNKTGLAAATLGNSSSIQVGDPVLAVGSPLGLTGTVTAGIVSSLNRPVETQQETQTQPTDPFGGNSGGTSATTQPTVIEAIQTDAAINPGNSGGALVNAVGQVIGVNSAIASLSDASQSGSQSGNIGVGFAIPVNQARTIANELISTGHALHPLLGVALQDTTSSAGVDRAIVHTVTSGGPAAKAGIKSGDVITAVDGQATPGVDAVIAAIRSHQPGQKVTVNIERGGSSQTITATLTAASSTQD